jgi:hypothetical protein
MAVPYTKQQNGHMVLLVILFGCLNILAPLVSSHSVLMQAVPVYLGLLLICILITFGCAVTTARGVQTDYAFGEGLRRACRGSNLLIETGEGQVFDSKSYGSAYNIAYYYTVSMLVAIITINALFIGILKYQDLTGGLWFLIVGGVAITGFVNLAVAVTSQYDYYKRLHLFSESTQSDFLSESYDTRPPDYPKLKLLALIWYLFVVTCVWYVSSNNFRDPHRKEDLAVLFRYTGLTYLAIILLAIFANTFGPLSSLLKSISEYSTAASSLSEGIISPTNVAKTPLLEYFMNNLRDYEGIGNPIGVRAKLIGSDSMAFKYLNVSTSVVPAPAPTHTGAPFAVALDADAYAAYQRIRSISMAEPVTTTSTWVMYQVYALAFMVLSVPFHKLFSIYSEYLGNGMLITVSGLIFTLVVYSIVSAATN